jgi:hypothetical protein
VLIVTHIEFAQAPVDLYDHFVISLQCGLIRGISRQIPSGQGTVLIVDYPFRFKVGLEPLEITISGHLRSSPSEIVAGSGLIDLGHDEGLVEIPELMVLVLYHHFETFGSGEVRKPKSPVNDSAGATNRAPAEVKPVVQGRAPAAVRPLATPAEMSPRAVPAEAGPLPAPAPATPPLSAPAERVPATGGAERVPAVAKPLPAPGRASGGAGPLPDRAEVR